MKKILSVLVMTLLCVGGVFAESKITFNVQLATGSEGMGYVMTSSSATVSNDYTTTSQSYSSSSTKCSYKYYVLHQSHGNKPSQGYAFARTSDASQYHFVGWSKTNNVDEIISSDFCYGPIGDLTKELYHCENITDNNGTFYAHFAENEVWDFVFNPVTEGGQYTVNYTSNSISKSATLTTTSAALNLSGITNADEASFTLKATASTNYRFLRWRFEYNDGTIEYNNNPNPTKKFAKSATISCEFISKDFAQFVVMSEINSYVYLSDAIAAAKVSASKVVVLKESGKLYLEAETTDYYDATAKKYTIPNDVTLLIPNSDNSADYVVHMGKITASQIDNSSSFAEKKCLMVDEEQDFDVHGNICVYAKITNNGSGAVKQYGRIHLGNDSHIVLKSGSKLNAIGYVTGHEKSSVVVESGAIVQEIIQMSDWRGGDAISDMVMSSGKTNRVFPINQYYVQNIEPKLIAHEGAVSDVTSMVNVGGFNFPVSATMFSPASGNYTGMFRLTEGTVLERYYDVESDRMNYTIRLADGYNAAEVSWDKVKLNLEAEDDGLGGLAANALLTSMGLSEISSADYILPINNNMDIHICEGINVLVQEDVAVLAGVELRIDKGAQVSTESASVYVYDADQHHVQWTDATVEYTLTTTGDQSLIQNYYYNYFSPANAFINKIPNRPGGLKYDRANLDLIEWINPDYPANKTKLQKNDAAVIVNGSFVGTIYTTDGGARIISDDPTANATIQFSNLTTPTIKQAIQRQYKEGDDTKQAVHYAIIPCKSSAALLNADGSYSAGGAASEENNKTYTYYPKWDNGDGTQGRWSNVLPEGEITALETTGNNITLAIPESQTGEVTFGTTIGEGFSIRSLKSVSFAGERFKENGNASYTDGQAKIPFTYTPTTTHEDNITIENPEELTVVFVCYETSTSSNVEKSVVIDLTATQNYQPSFTINGKDDESITLTFPPTYVWQTSEAQVITVAAVEGNVTDRSKNGDKGYVTWTPAMLSADSPFEVVSGDYFEGAQIVYKPMTTAGNHTQTLTITAKYSDGIEEQKTITLQGSPILAQNPLAFVVASQEIYPGDVINPLFTSIGNGESIDFTYNGAEASDIVEIVNVEGNYQLQVKSGVNIITQQEITINATQSDNAVTGAGSASMTVIVTPSVQWNWSKLYFENSYDEPIVVKNEDPWTLTYNNDCAVIPAANFTGDATNGYSVQVGKGNEGTATFTFKQGGYTYTFESEVYADPRELDVCLRDENALRTYTDITIEQTNVRFENGIVFATTENDGAAWTMTLLGVPDKVEFVPQGDGKKWTIQEYNGVSWATTYVEHEISLAEGQDYFTHNLKASTQQIRIICSSGTTQGKLTDLCVFALDASASANTEKLYMPIVKDENGSPIQSQKSIVLSYVSPESDLWLNVADELGNAIADITLTSDNLSSGKLPQTTVQNIYREETITVSSTYAIEGIVYLVVRDNLDNEMLKLPIRLYSYPQPIPIRTADWNGADAEKYYFYTDFERSQNVQFNEVTQKLTFASTDNAQRFITFVFRGGPSYISFESSLDFVPQDEITPAELVLQEWYDYWTLEITDGESPRLVANNAEADVQPEIVAEVRDGKTYYQIRVAIPYTTKSITLQSKRAMAVEVENLVIEGEPELDVVSGNHTIEHEAEVNFTHEAMTQDVMVTAINLEQLKVSCNNPHFTVKHAASNISSTATTLTSIDCPNALGSYMVGNITLNVTWDGANMVEEGLIIFTNQADQILGTVRLLGAKDFILKGNSQNTGLFTGFAENINNHPFKNEDNKYQYARRQVNLFNAFDANGVALFDYLIIYGETTAEDLGNTITAPTTTNGSNANTPIYIYRKMQNDQGVYDRYQFVFDQANVNQGQKVALHTAIDTDGNAVIPHAKETEGTEYINIAEGEQLRVYMTGFCPYASTGFEKTQEGVWLFRGKKNAKLDVYLEDCHIYSRNKTQDGHSYTGKTDHQANIFQEDYARGSGGVLVFECNQEGEYVDSEAFQVTIHTRGSNLLKSNYGCFYEILGVRAYQVSSPVQIRLTSNINFEENSKTHLTFDDKWPTMLDANRVMADSVRTNGFISLQKQANNAPSIDMGNGNTIVNFRGGQVELQNAQNVSDKYKTTLAISYRSGIMATGGVEIQMAYGIGTDAATKGTVNFYDGTISVIPMYVDPADRKYYLMDIDANGNELTTTSCLRCPQNTFVYGGSICMLRTCMSPTSQGGAPTDGVRPLGRFFYTEQHGYEYNTENKLQPTTNDDAAKWLVNPVKFPTDITLFEGLADYHQNEGKYTYGVESVTPNEEGQLILWIPDGFGGVEAEQDRYLTPWKACMPEITAVLAEVGITTIGGTVGGPTAVENLEEVENLLYCQLDEHIYDVISETTGEGDDERYVYEAPLKVPDGFQMDGVDLGFGDYLRLAPSNIGAVDEYEMENEEDYSINSRVYYISSATADVWQTFTAPFDVENIWVVETYDENVLSQTTLTDQEFEEGTTQRAKVLKIQATHNADFASFFGVAMALGSDKDFDGIFGEYLDWAAYVEDNHQGAIEDYTKRGKFTLTPYDGTNWADANFYLYHNAGNWTIQNAEDGEFTPQWEFAQKQGDVLLEKGETYSLLFPYCVGCDDDLESRDYWDYWSGKLIIFESTQASKDNPHVIRGSNFVAPTQPEEGEWVFQSEDIAENPSEVVVTGNSTFANMITERTDVFVYSSDVNEETFKPMQNEDETILPTTAFLYGDIPANAQGLPARGVRRTGEILYDDPNNGGNGNTSNLGNVPTINGGSDIFVTEIANGINIAVVSPQYVRVLSSAGALLYNGMVETSVDVNLPNNGIYVVAGENNSIKIMY